MQYRLCRERATQSHPAHSSLCKGVDCSLSLWFAGLASRAGSPASGGSGSPQCGADKREEEEKVGYLYGKLFKAGKVTNTATEVGIGTNVFLKADLARAERCGVDDRCWFVGLAHKDGEIEEPYREP